MNSIKYNKASIITFILGLTLGITIGSIVGYNIISSDTVYVVEDKPSIEVNCETQSIATFVNEQIEEDVPESINYHYLSDADVKVLKTIVFTEAGQSNTYEWQLITECVLYRYYRWGGTKRGTLKEYIEQKKWDFQGYQDKHKYTDAKKMRGDKSSWKRNRHQKYLDINRIVEDRVNYKNRCKKGQPRQIKNYHNKNIKGGTIKLNGKTRKLNVKHIQNIEKQAAIGKLNELDDSKVNLIHDFYEIPQKDEVYYEWRKRLKIK